MYVCVQNKKDLGNEFTGAQILSFKTQLQSTKIDESINDLLAFWKFDGTGKDANGNIIYNIPDPITGTSGSVLSYGPNRNSQLTTALSLTDTVILPSLPMCGDFTITAWIKLNSLQPQNIMSISNAISGTSITLTINLVPSITIVKDTITSPFTLTSQTTLANGTWYYLAYSNRGFTSKIYINGILKSQLDSPFLLGSVTYNTNNIGNSGGTTIIDDLKVYNQALDQDDIVASFNAN